MAGPCVSSAAFASHEIDERLPGCFEFIESLAIAFSGFGQEENGDRRSRLIESPIRARQSHRGLSLMFERLAITPVDSLHSGRRENHRGNRKNT